MVDHKIYVEQYESKGDDGEVKRDDRETLKQDCEDKN